MRDFPHCRLLFNSMSSFIGPKMMNESGDCVIYIFKWKVWKLYNVDYDPAKPLKIIEASPNLSAAVPIDAGKMIPVKKAKA